MITIVGLGALGSHAALFLRNHDEAFRLIDFDRVEMKNTQAQFHSRLGGVGSNKSTALSNALTTMFGTRAVALPRKVTKSNCPQLLGGSSIVLDCTDNLLARSTIQRHALASNIPCVHGTLSGDGTFGTVVWSERFVADQEAHEGHTCEDGRHLPFYVFVASVLTIVVTNFLQTGSRQSYHICPAAVTRI